LQHLRLKFKAPRSETMLFRLQVACIFMISTRNGLFFASERTQQNVFFGKKDFWVFS
jgi:hypothetical protein